MIKKELLGYVLSRDNTKMYSIIVDEQENKCYQLDAEFELLDINPVDVIAERQFKMLVDENDDVSFVFLDNYINKDITLEDLKTHKGL